MTEKNSEKRPTPSDYLKILKDEYSDKIFNRPLKLGEKPKEKGKIGYKSSRDWFQGIVSVINLLEDNIPDELVGDTQGFLRHYTSDEFHNQEIITSEDVNKGNHLLDNLISKISKDK